MFAVIATGGKQHRVEPGEVLCVEKLSGEAGDLIDLDKVLMTGSQGGIAVGSPYVEGARVTAEILEHARDRKVMIIKLRRRKNYRRRQGHRQWFTRIRIKDIVDPNNPDGISLEADEHESVSHPGAIENPSDISNSEQEDGTASKARVLPAATGESEHGS